MLYIVTMTISWRPNLQKEDTPLFLAITKALAQDISSGKLPHNTRLPTHRDLADYMKVALGTVTRAYIEAERRGLIRSEGRRGTFVGEQKQDKSALSKLIDFGSKTINFSHNHPNYGDDPDLNVALRQIARRSETQKLLQYPPSAGFSEHREIGAQWIKSLGMAVDPESIVITAGAQHALMVVFAAIAGKNDIILTDCHTYPGLKAITELLGLQLMGVQMDGEGIVPEALESICNQRAVRAIYCNPTLQNPTTIVYSEQRRQEIASLAEEYDFAIVEDEILRPLVEKPPPFISSFAPDRSFIIVSASKTIAAGLRVGFVSSPTKARQRIIDSLQTSILCASPLSAEVIASWIKNGMAEKIIQRRRKDLKLRQKLAGSLFDPETISGQPTSPHLWLKLPGNWTGNEFTIEAYRRGVSVTPAELFAVDKNALPNAVRISMATVLDHATLKTGLEILASILAGTPLQDSATV